MADTRVIPGMASLVIRATDASLGLFEDVIEFMPILEFEFSL
jgi:hypothetical protein